MKIQYFTAIFIVVLNSTYLWGVYRLNPLIDGGLKKPLYAQAEPHQKGRYWVLEQCGRIRIYTRDKLLEKPFLDISHRVRCDGEMGLLGLAFHPEFEKNRKFYLNYNPKAEMSTIVSEFHAETLQEKILLKFDQPYTNHNGGGLGFGPDGYLYIGSGDGGSANDPHGHGQNLRSLLGKILRIDVNRGAPYAIPLDNPISEKQGRPEIFAWGLRNPWRFSFDSVTGLLFVADVGQFRREEINLVRNGKNYGWSIFEGSLCFRDARSCQDKNFEKPIFEYSRTDGISVTGGYVYRGQALVSLMGAYVFGDFGSGKIWALHGDFVSKNIRRTLLLDSGLPISSFGLDENNEILVVSYQGSVYRLVGDNR